MTDTFISLSHQDTAYGPSFTAKAHTPEGVTTIVEAEAAGETVWRVGPWADRLLCEIRVTHATLELLKQAVAREIEP